MNKVVFFLLILVNSISIKSYGQEENLSPELLAWYQETLPFFQEIITGGQYSEAPINYLGSPFYESRVFGTGQIWINDISYKKVQLLYDAWLDQVVTFHPIYNQKILIKSEKIEKFILSDGSEFLRFTTNPDYGRHNHGFYQLLSDGELKLLKKHYRKVEAVSETGRITREFTEEQDYFFWFKEEFWKVSSKKEGAFALGLSKKAVNSHFKGNDIDFKKDPEAYLLGLLQLNKNEGEGFKGFPAK